MAGAAESLYEAMGCESALAWVVDDFYVRVLADPNLSGTFVGTSMSKLKGRQVAFLAAALAAAGVPAGTVLQIVETIAPLADDIVSRGLS